MSKILIIDDNKDLCKMLSESFSQKGLDVDYSLTLAQGLDQLFSNQVDVLFLDVNLPDGDGLAAIPRINAHPPNRKSSLSPVTGTKPAPSPGLMPIPPNRKSSLSPVTGTKPARILPLRPVSGIIFPKAVRIRIFLYPLIAP